MPFTDLINELNIELPDETLEPAGDGRDKVIKEKGSIQTSFGIFHYHEDFQSYELDDGKI